MTGRRILIAAGLVGGLAAVALAAAWLVFVDDSPTPLTKAQGAFYSAPADIPKQLGTVIRSQPEAVATVIGAPVGTKAVRVLYASSDFRTGAPIAVSGTVYVPPHPARGRPVVAWAHGTTGVASTCAPSLDASPGAPLVAGIGDFLKAGWIVTATDYPGLGTQGPHPYLVGTSEGRAVLDSIRAAQALQLASAGRTAVIWGHSQGGGAALWAAQLQPKYAPELHLIGTAAAAPASELAPLMRAQGDSLTGQLIGSLVLWSWSKTVPGADIDAVTSADARELINSVAAGCTTTSSSLVKALAPAALEKLTKAINIERILSNPGWAASLSANSVPLLSSGPPLFIAQGTNDTVVHPSVTSAVVSTLCARGRNVVYRPLPGATHNQAGTEAAPQAVAWAVRLLAGNPPESNCGK